MVLKTFKIEFSDNRQAIAVNARPDTSAEIIAAALSLAGSHKVLLLSTGAGKMSSAAQSRLTALFDALTLALSKHRVTIIDGGTDSGGMAMMGRSLAKTARSAPYVGVLPAKAEAGPGVFGTDILEPNHSHLVLLDDDQWGAEIPLMSGLAAYLAPHGNSVTLLVNGGQIALQDIEESVQAGRPVIVVEGSGRLADELAQAVKHPQRPAAERVKNLAQSGKIIVFEPANSPEDLVQLVLALLKGETHSHDSGNSRR